MLAPWRTITWQQHRPPPEVSAPGRERSVEEAPTGIEPVEALLRPLEPKIRLYVEHFRVIGVHGSDK